MQPIQFIHWLKGILDANPDGLNISQFNLVKNTTDKMFDHADKEVEKPKSKPTLKELLEPSGINVIENMSTTDFNKKPQGWTKDWVLGVYGWEDPDYRMRC